MGEGLLYQTGLKVGGTNGIPDHFLRRRRSTRFGYGLLRCIAIRSAIRADIIIG